MLDSVLGQNVHIQGGASPIYAMTYVPLSQDLYDVNLPMRAKTE